MKRIKHRAFSLIEVLLAMSLASLIMMAIAQVQRGVVRYLDATRQTMIINRKVSLLFNQFERDVGSAFVPFLHQLVEEKPASAPSPEEEKKKKEEDEKKLEEFRKIGFIAEIDDRADGILVDNKRLYPSGRFSFICSNPFQVYGQKYMRLVRVVYELVLDKTKKSESAQTYQLIRKETFELANVKARIEEFGKPEPDKVVRKYVVMDGVKGLYLQFSARISDLRKTEEEKKKEKESKPKPDAPKNYVSQLWGDQFSTQGIIPEHISVWLDVWNNDKTRAMRYVALFGTVSYPTIDERKARVQSDAQAKPDEQTKKDPTEAAGAAVQPQDSAGFAQALGV